MPKTTDEPNEADNGQPSTLEDISESLQEIPDVDTLSIYSSHVEALVRLLRVWVAASRSTLSEEDTIVMDALRHRLKMMLNCENYEILLQAESVKAARSLDQEG